MAGATMDEVLGSAQLVARDVDTLDRNWRDWVATQAAGDEGVALTANAGA